MVDSLREKEKHGYGRAEVVLKQRKIVGFVILGLHKTRRAGQPVFEVAGFPVFCIRTRTDHTRKDRESGQHGFGLWRRNWLSFTSAKKIDKRAPGVVDSLPRGQVERRHLRGGL